ncbi:MAG TPA: hypothetical protein VIT65_18115 [Microlunatus sp.]
MNDDLPDGRARIPAHLLDRPWLDETLRERLKPQFTLRLRCSVDVLIVTDGADFSFDVTYSLGRLVQAMTTDLPPYVRVNVTTARHASFPGLGVFDIPSFRFHTSDLSGFDEVWIIAVGSGSNAYLPGELTALYEFMQSGGGVFATGNHANLGVALCGGIPRVRSMRRWHYPSPGPHGEPVAPGAVADRHETTVGSDFDGTPQVITPQMYPLGWSHTVLFRRVAPHPVLCGRNGPVTVLPDHMHEGAIVVPPVDLSLPVDGIDVEEYQHGDGVRVSPLVIATAVDHHAPGGAFGVIGAYDGHLVDEVPGGVGRIVVDATWHHLFGMNVEQFASAYDAVQAGSTDPLMLERAGHWQQIKDYFQNTAIWLARASTQRCVRRRGLWLVATHIDVVMALRAWRLDRGERLEYLLDVGQKAKDAFHRVAPQCQRIELSLDLVARLRLYERLRPWPVPIPDPPPFRFAQLVDPGWVETVALGGALVAVHEQLQGDLGRLEKDDDALAAIAADGAAAGVKILAAELGRNGQEIASLLEERGRR